jgi:hypothetical protein
MRGALFFIGILAIGLSGCIRKPNYPDVPVISFQSAQFTPNTDITSSALDSLLVTVHFTDGNGDLGLTSDDRNTQLYAKYGLDPDSTTFNLRYYNYFLTLFAENAFGKFDSTPTRYTNSGHIDEISRYGAFFPTDDMNRGQPLEGTIAYQVKDYLVYINKDTPQHNKGRIIKGKRWYVEVRIQDRSGNISNKVQSPIYTY